MFSSLARRLTGWYVAAAVILVLIVTAAFAAVALAYYARLVDQGIADAERSAAAFAQRAAGRRQTFESAAAEFESREHRTGVRIFASKPPPLPPGAHGRPSLRPDHGRDRIVPLIADGHVVYRPRSARFDGNRIGIALATGLGVRGRRDDFLDGDMFFAPDVDAFAAIGIWLLGAVLAISALAGVIAWAGGRYITSQVLRPLIDVTHALQRFAARDFTPQPIAVAGKSDFDEIALAYNAAAAQVAAAFAERRAAEAQMRQFVADAGHELRTPLTIVLGYIDLLRRRTDAGDERARRIFTTIDSESARMRTLIDNLVLLARMEGENTRLSEPFALLPLLAELIDARRVLYPSLALTLDAAVDATVIGDRTEMHEAIANVVDNAIKYAPGSPVAIAVRPDGSGVAVSVTDRGPGIHPDDRGAVFDRFYRGATRGDVDGSGLGLAIAKRAVERAGGTLSLSASSPAGTTFTFRLRTDEVHPVEARTRLDR